MPKPTPKPTRKIIQTRKMSWLDHAERHFKDGSVFYAGDFYLVDDAQESLMYLCLFSYSGMFDCSHNPNLNSAA